MWGWKKKLVGSDSDCPLKTIISWRKAQQFQLSKGTKSQCHQFDQLIDRICKDLFRNARAAVIGIGMFVPCQFQAVEKNRMIVKFEKVKINPRT